MRVHLVVGVPDRLELAERPDELRRRTSSAGARPSTGRRRARPRSSRRGATTRSAASSRNARKCLDALGRLQVEVDPGVDATLAEVAVERAVVAVLFEQLAEVAAGTRRACRAARPSPPSPPRRRARPAPGPWPRGPTRGPSRGVPPAPRRRRASSTAGSSVFRRRSISRWALSSASSLVSPPNSTSSQPFPSGSRSMSLGWIFFFFMSLTRPIVDPLQARSARTSGSRRRGRRRCRRRDSRAPAPTCTPGCGTRWSCASRTVTQRPLRAAEGPGDVEAASRAGGRRGCSPRRAGEASWVGIALADQVGVLVAERLQPGVDLPFAPARGDDPLQLLLARGADGHPGAVVEQDVQLVDLVGGPAGSRGP